MQTISLGKAGSIDVDVAALRAMPQVEEYIFSYGLKQMLNDVHAGEKDADKKKALSQKKLDSLLRGEVAQARVGRTGDPIMREMLAMAETDLKAKLVKIGKKVKDYEKSVWAAVVQKQVDANAEAYRTAAEAKLAIKPEGVESADDILALLDSVADESDPESKSDTDE